MAKRGKPPLPEGKALSATLHVRMTPKMLAELPRRAKKAGFSNVGDWIRHLVQEKK